MSKDFEHTIANGIHENTGRNTRAYRCGYSGNSKHPQPDVLVTAPAHNHAMEVKKRRGKYAYVEKEDLEQLEACQNDNTDVYLVVKFVRWEPVVVKLYRDIIGREEWNERSLPEKFAGATPSVFEPEVTDNGTLRLLHPKHHESDEWSSTEKGREDWRAVADGVGLVHEETKEVSL